MKMKLSEQTVAVLKNFASINQSIHIKDGDLVKTRSLSRELVAAATIGDAFPKDFSIYDLNRFLNVLSLFNEPELDFGQDDNAVVIGSGKNSVRYVFSDSDLIGDTTVQHADYAKNPKMPNILAEFKVSQENLGKVIKAANILGAPTITITGSAGVLKVVAHDKKNPSCDSFKLEIGQHDGDDFAVDFKIETIKFIPGDYDISISERVICRFVNEAAKVTYYIAGDVQQ